MAKEQEKKQGFFGKIVKWFKGIKSEIKKIIWPTPKKIGKDTLVVIVSVLVLGAFLSVINWVLHYGVDKLIAK